jgi:hypothetical protein
MRAEPVEQLLNPGIGLGVRGDVLVGDAGPDVGPVVGARVRRQRIHALGEGLHAAVIRVCAGAAELIVRRHAIARGDAEHRGSKRPVRRLQLFGRCVGREAEALRGPLRIRERRLARLPSAAQHLHVALVHRNVPRLPQDLIARVRLTLWSQPVLLRAHRLDVAVDQSLL